MSPGADQREDLLELKKLETIFRHKVFMMLVARRKISREMITLISTWRHSGFQVFCGNRISPDDETAVGNRPAASFGRHSPGKGCSTWITRRGSSIQSKTAKQLRASLRWNGWPRCVPTSRTGASRWYSTTDSASLSDTPVELVILTSILT